MELNKSFHLYACFTRSMKRKSVIIVALLLVVQQMYAQGATDPDFMRSTGKIYVVAGVCIVILLTLLVYLVLLDRKINKLENRRHND